MIKKLIHKNNDEIGKIVNSINLLIEGNTNTALFANEIGKGNLDAKLLPLSDNDVLGSSLIEMRNNLQNAKEAEIKRNIEELMATQEDMKRNIENNITV